MSKWLKVCLGFVFSRFTGMQRLGQVLLPEGPASFSVCNPFRDCIPFPCARGGGVTHDDSWF